MADCFSVTYLAAPDRRAVQGQVGGLGLRERNQWLRTAQVRAIAIQDPLAIVLTSRGDIQEPARSLSVL